MEGEAQQNELLFKVIVVGDFATGKTSLIRRFCFGKFTEAYKTTIGVDFCMKKLDWESTGDKLSLQLWDIAGHERFGTMLNLYYRYAVAAVVVFDLTRDSTLTSCKRWIKDVDNHVSLPSGEGIPKILVANKSDLVDENNIDTSRLDSFCEENGVLRWLSTSAKTEKDVELSFLSIAEDIMKLRSDGGLPDTTKSTVEDTQQRRVKLAEKKQDGFQIGGMRRTQKKKNSCC